MGTRHLVCVFYQGKWWIAQYGQWDGYPEVQGVRIFRFLSVARNIEDLKAGLAHVYVPTKDELDAISGELDAWESAQQLGEESSLREWPCAAYLCSPPLLTLVFPPQVSGAEDGGWCAEEDVPRARGMGLRRGRFADL